MRKWVPYMLVVLIALQSVLAVADSHEEHHSDTDPQGIYHSFTDTEDGNSINSQVPPPSDLDQGETFTYLKLTDPSEGAISSWNSSTGAFTFDPLTDFQDLRQGATRDVTFTYRTVNQNNDESNIATVTITVTGTNDIPETVSATTGSLICSTS